MHRLFFAHGKKIFCVLVVCLFIAVACQTNADTSVLEYRLEKVEKTGAEQQTKIDGLAKQTDTIKSDIALITSVANFVAQLGLPRWVGQVTGIFLTILSLAFGYLIHVKNKISSLKKEAEQERDEARRQFNEFRKTHEALDKKYETISRNYDQLAVLLENINDGKELKEQIAEVQKRVGVLKAAQPTSLEDVLALKISDLRNVAGIYLFPCYARLAIEEENWEEARFFWGKYLAAVPDDAVTRYFMGWCLLQQANTTENIFPEEQYHLFIQACFYFKGLSAMPDLQGHKDYRWAFAEAQLRAAFCTDDACTAERLQQYALSTFTEVATLEQACCPEEAIASYLLDIKNTLQHRERPLVAQFALTVCQEARPECSIESSFLNQYGLVLLFTYSATINGTPQESILLMAIDKFKESIDHDSQNFSAWNNWGYALRDLAELEPDADKKSKLLHDAIEKHGRATELSPQGDAAWTNWGYALRDLAELEQNADKKSKLLHDAIEKCERVTELNPGNDAAWNNWGYALNGLADLEQDADKKSKLLQDVIEKYERATELNPGNYAVWTNWGYALNGLADLEPDADKKSKLLHDAIEKCERATELNSGNDVAWTNWGYALNGLADLEQDADKEVVPFVRTGNSGSLACLFPH